MSMEAKLYRAARPMLACLFITAGIDTWRRPASRAKLAEPFLSRMRETFPVVPDDTVALVRANATIHAVAGTAFALGVKPRLSAVALAASLIPTTLAGHAFWEIEDPTQRMLHRLHFEKNLAVFGGLLTAFGLERHMDDDA